MYKRLKETFKGQYYLELIMKQFLGERIYKLKFIFST